MQICYMVVLLIVGISFQTSAILATSTPRFQDVLVSIHKWCWAGVLWISSLACVLVCYIWCYCSCLLLRSPVSEGSTFRCVLSTFYFTLLSNKFIHLFIQYIAAVYTGQLPIYDEYKVSVLLTRLTTDLMAVMKFIVLYIYVLLL